MGYVEILRISTHLDLAYHSVRTTNGRSELTRPVRGMGFARTIQDSANDDL